jgi:hypothetical protein
LHLFHGRRRHCVLRPFEMVLIYQPPNAHAQISWILLRNAMAAAAVKNIYDRPTAESTETDIFR